MSDLSSLPIGHNFHKKKPPKKQSGICQTAATRGPAIGYFAHQNTLMLLRLKQTHTFTHLCTNLVSLKRKGGMLHTHTRPGGGATGG